VGTQPPQRIRTELDKILSSSTFASAERMRGFLTFVVEHTLSSSGEPLKEIIIGMELYSSREDFDPRISAAVRVDASRLRGKLREYYVQEGAADPVVIELPRGSYTPVFRDNPARADSVASASPTEPAVAARSIGDRSIVVLPFSNLSPEPEDYFSDGLTEEIIHALSSVPGIRVVARASAFSLRHRHSDVREVGRALNVSFVLEGSVRRSKRALRVTAQLASTSDGYQLWSRRWDRQVDDVFAVQDEIAEAIAAALQVSGAAGRHRAPATAHTGSFEAYEWYLRGRHHLNRQTPESLHRAVDCFQEAVSRDPQQAAAFTGIAFAQLYLGLFAMEAPLTTLPKARDAAARAFEIDEREGDALSVLACIKAMFDWDWSGAEALFRQALQIHPQSGIAKNLCAAFLLLPLARFEEALALLDEAKRTDPVSLLISSNQSAALLMARRNAEAEAECRRALELNTDFWRALVGLGRCHEANGRFQDAIACYEQARVLSDEVPTSIGALGRVYALTGRTKEARRLLQELDALAAHRYVSAYGRVLIHLGLGDGKVFEWLDRSCDERAGWLMYLATDPRFDSLREDRRFQAVLERLRLPVIRFPVHSTEASAQV
jgi:TolB-like protein/Tfp pilus assembly protein PilF